MHLGYQFLTLVHLVGFAALLGGCLVQFRDPVPEINKAMLIGAWTQVVSGLALVVLAEIGPDPVNHAKVGVKLGIAAVVLLLVAKNRKFQSIPPGLWWLITGLILVNAGVAVLWR